MICMACNGDRLLTRDDYGPWGGETTSECDECGGTGVQPCTPCRVEGEHTDAVATIDRSAQGGPRDWAVCGCHRLGHALGHALYRATRRAAILRHIRRPTALRLVRT